MNIILTESQYKKIIESTKEQNFKSALYFDELYGTNLSHRYDFGNGLDSDKIWDIWVECRDSGDCDDMKKLIINLSKLFPYYDVTKLPTTKRAEIIMGMASEYNPSDIIAFSVYGLTYENNIEQKRLEKQLPPEIGDNIRWVLSPESIQYIRNKFGINEI
jgi:hypothetical protein